MQPILLLLLHINRYLLTSLSGNVLIRSVLFLNCIKNLLCSICCPTNIAQVNLIVSTISYLFHHCCARCKYQSEIFVSRLSMGKVSSAVCKKYESKNNRDVEKKQFVVWVFVYLCFSSIKCRKNIIPCLFGERLLQKNPPPVSDILTKKQNNVFKSIFKSSGMEKKANIRALDTFLPFADSGSRNTGDNQQPVQGLIQVACAALGMITKHRHILTSSLRILQKALFVVFIIAS